ncbi:MAG: hypothetical protein JJU29_22075 [Verrucomicrobia bacterium]|nr:hypothetical protein [Verrucomicrobiota bacterium]MCH8514216.1 hypothetical protein [Kiritimatiellia bacterium]
MKAFKWIRNVCPFILPVLLALQFSGCATTAMKGTPFYTGEWEERTGPVEDRIMLWPFLYYREPALSVMWPIYEQTPDHVAVRPLYTVRGLSTGRKVHTVLWPLGKFDTHRKEYRFFPVFWDQNDFLVFPVYWHLNDPFGGNRGTNSLFPLWIYTRRNPEHHILHLGWPLARFERSNALRRNRVFPLFATYAHENGRTHFISLPYGNQVDPRADSSRQWIFPFYVRFSDPKRSGFFSLPYGWQQEGDAFSRYALMGLWGQSEKADKRNDWLLPLYIRHQDADAKSFYTLLGGGTWREDGTGNLITPLYMNFREENSERMIVPPLLAMRHREVERTDWYFPWPLGRFSSGEAPQASYLFPLFYRDPEGGTFLSPLYQQGAREEDEMRWRSVFPLVYYRTSPESTMWVTPLAGVTRHEDGRGRTVTPLYARVEDKPGHILHVVPPLLSWRIQEPTFTENWLLMGLARWSRGEEARPSHIFPFYYQNPNSEAVLSPFYARWTRNDGGQIRAVPPLLSWRVEQPEGERQDFLLGGLYGQQFDAESVRQRSHLFPLYSWQRDDHLFTPLYGRDHPEDGRYRYWLTPLVGSYRNQRSGFWLFPFLNWNQDAESGHHRSSFLLWGQHRTRENYRMTSWFPVFNREVFDQPRPGFRSAYTREADRFSLLLLYRRSREVVNFMETRPKRIGGEEYPEVTRSLNRLFPLWRFEREQFGEEGQGPELAEGNILWRLYDHRTEAGTEEKPHDYVRRRILWRLWHYERLDGDVSVDSFPFITYDRKTDGFKRVSFMWRVFRYENSPEEGTKLDLLFLPLRRGNRG